MNRGSYPQHFGLCPYLRAGLHGVQQERAASLPHRPHSIAWCVREAEKRGMSYGRFVGLGLDKEGTA